MRIVFEIENAEYAAIDTLITRLVKELSDAAAKKMPSLSFTSGRVPDRTIDLLITIRDHGGTKFSYLQKENSAEVTIDCFNRNVPFSMLLAKQIMDAVVVTTGKVTQKSYLPFCTWEQMFGTKQSDRLPLLKEYFEHVGVTDEQIPWYDDWEEVFDSLYPKISYSGLIAFALDTGKAKIGRGYDGEFTLDLDSKYGLPNGVKIEIERQMYGNAISKIGDIAMKFTQSLIGEYCRRMVDLQTKGENPDDFTVECSFDNPELDLVRNKVTKTPDPL